MNGPQHFAEAERILANAAQVSASAGPFLSESQTRGIEMGMSIALVHATLALAAATVDASTGDTREYPEWEEALS